MAISTTINDVDRSIHLLARSLSIGLRENEPGRASCTFRSRIPSLSVPDYRPTEGDSIAFFWNGTRFFSGEITGVRTRHIASPRIDGVRQPAVVFHELSISGLEIRLNQRYVGVTAVEGPNGEPGFICTGGTWASTEGAPVTDDMIVSELVSTYGTPGMSTETATAAEISRIVVGTNGPETAWSVIRQRAIRNGFIAYFDNNHVLHFKPRGADEAPFVLTSESANYTRLEYTTSRQQTAHNRQIRRLPYKSVDPRVEVFQGDGSTTEFELSQNVGRIETIHIATANGNDRYEQQIGVNGVNTNDFDWGYTPGTPGLVAMSNVPALTSSEVLKVTYRAMGDDLVIENDEAAQNAWGRVVERFVDDSHRTGVTYDDAVGMARADMAQSNVLLQELQMETTLHNEPNALLTVPGMSVSVENMDLGPNGESLSGIFYVRSVDISDLGKELLRFSIAMTGKEGADASAAATSEYTPRKQSGAEKLRQSTSGVTRPPQEMDKGSAQDSIAEMTVYGVGVGEPAAVADDVTLHRGVYSSGTPFELVVTPKVAAVTSPTVLDLRVTNDGTTWTSLFAADALPQVPVGQVMPIFFNSFAENAYIERGQKMRCDVKAADGTTQDIHVLLRWRRIPGIAAPVDTTEDGDTDTLPVH